MTSTDEHTSQKRKKNFSAQKTSGLGSFILSLILSVGLFLVSGIVLDFIDKISLKSAVSRMTHLSEIFGNLGNSMTYVLGMTRAELARDDDPFKKFSKIVPIFSNDLDKKPIQEKLDLAFDSVEAIRYSLDSKDFSYFSSDFYDTAKTFMDKEVCKTDILVVNLKPMNVTCSNDVVMKDGFYKSVKFILRNMQAIVDNAELMLPHPAGLVAGLKVGAGELFNRIESYIYANNNGLIRVQRFQMAEVYKYFEK